jgi:ankyrin repeat protein
MNDQALGLAAAAGHTDVVDQLLALGAYIRADNDAVSACCVARDVWRVTF